MSAAVLDLAGLMRTVLIMSLAGSAIALLLFASKPLIKNRLPKAVQYYMWLAVLAALVVPFSRIVVLPAPPVSGELAVSLTPIHYVVRQSVFTVEEELDRLSALPPDASEKEVGSAQSGISAAATIFSIVWPLGAVTFAGYNLTGYLMFVQRLKKRAIPAGARECALLRTFATKGRFPRVYISPLAPTPMLTGIIRPAIILPDGEYTDEQLQGVLLHELTHLRRHDVAVKWLSVLAGALHWFNPLARLVRREIDRSCELACDEAVIRRLDISGKQSYGDTLIAVTAGRRLPRSVLSTTMCDDKKVLKERLGAIMRYKRFSMKAVILSCVLLAAVICGAVVLGASSGASELEDNTPPVVGESGEYAPNAAAEKPVVKLYSYDLLHDNGDKDVEKRHIVSELTPEPDTGLTRLTQTIFADITMPDGTVELQVFYVPDNGTGANGSIGILTDNVNNESSNQRGLVLHMQDFFPDGFLGHIWVLTTDTGGLYHMSAIIRVVYEPETVGIGEAATPDYVGGDYLWPVPVSSEVVSRFGVRIHPYSGTTVSHDGIDIIAPEGAEIIAANTGMVIAADKNESDGLCILLDHGGGQMTFYAHLSGFAEGIAVGDMVTQGGVIGYVGSTGKATGSHLHYSVSVNGDYQNPLDYYPAEEWTLERSS